MCNRKNKLRIYKTIVKPILCFGAETWRLTKKAEDMLDKFERKVLRRIFGPVLDAGRCNKKIYDMYREISIKP